MKKFCVLLIVIAIGSCAVGAQTIVDATGPTNSRLRNPTGGRVGSFGRILQVDLTIRTPSGVPESQANEEIEFVVTNSGKNDLVIPVRTNPRDFEPPNASQSYRLKIMRLNVSLADDQRVGNVVLYGTDLSPGSLISLHPGEWLAVRARVQLPASPARFFAHLILNDQTVSSTRGQIVEDTQEIGSAMSKKYRMQDSHVLAD